MSTFAYLYRWTQKSTGMWYEGSRTERGCHPEDGYICSSKKVKPMITENLDDWTREILVIGEPAYIRKLEEIRLNDLDAKNNPMSYNEDNADGKFTTTGKTPWNKGIKRPRNKPAWNSGKKAPQISAAKKGKPAHNKGQASPLKGKPNGKKGKPSIKVVCRMFDKKEMAIGNFNQWCELQDNPIKLAQWTANLSASGKGRKQSADHVKARAEARRGKKNPNPSPMLGQPKPKLVSRLIDKKPMSISNFIQWCGLVDKQVKTKEA